MDQPGFTFILLLFFNLFLFILKIYYYEYSLLSSPSYFTTENFISLYFF